MCGLIRFACAWKNLEPGIYLRSAIILLASFFFFVYGLVPQSEQDSKGVKVIEVSKNGERIILYENSYVLLVGVSKYEHWPNLNNIPKEISTLESSLKKQGFIVETSLNPTGSQLSETIKNFIDKYGFKENNRLLFFFSGHGYTRKDGTKGYIVPSDATDPGVDEMNFVRNAIEMGQIMAWARRIEAKHALFVFDSCFSGTIFKTRDFPTPAYISYITAKPVRQFITAGDAGELLPAKSYFVPCFIRGIEGEADAYLDGYITATELGLFLQREIKNYNIGQTPQYGKMRDPELDQGDFVFIGKKVVGPKTSTPVKTSFGLIERAEIKENSLIAFDKNGNQWQKAFESKIFRHAVTDIDGDGKKEILVGFSAENKESNQVIVFDSKENKKWVYLFEPQNAYINSSSGKFSVRDLKVFIEKKIKIIAVLFADEYWYQSALIILSPGGKKLKELWHPGHLHQIEKIKDVFIVRAVNNDLRQTSISKNPKRYFSVIFGIKYENIFGQAPPYFGRLEKNDQFDWYCILSDQQVSFLEMKVLEEKILACTTCGKCFYFNEKGPLENVGYTDGYSCKEPLNLLGWKFK
jgi:hypothetical protein